MLILRGNSNLAYPKKPSMSDSIAYPIVKPTMMSMLGSGKSSLGKALFNSLKYVQTLIPLVYFIMGTIFDIHYAYSIR